LILKIRFSTVQQIKRCSAALLQGRTLSGWLN